MSDAKAKKAKWQRWLLSETMCRKNVSHQIAYVSVMTALTIVANMFFEFKLADVQFSFTLFLSALTGIIIGPLFGFAACFLGDLVGFLYHSSGYPYYPWIGLAMGMAAVIAGVITGGVPSKKSWFLYVKLTLICLLIFAVCTVGINTTAFWKLYSKVSYKEYFIARIFIQGQIWNTLVNSALLFVVVPSLNRIKPLKIHIR